MSAIRLENLLEKAAKDPAFRPDFYAELMNSELIVLYQPDCNNELKSGFVHLEKDTAVKIKQFRSQDGRVIIPIFTDVEAIRKGIKTEENYLQFNAKQLFEITKGASYILNPYSDYAKEFTPEEVSNLLNDTVSQSDTHIIEKETKVLVGQPRVYPHRLVKALRRYFSKTNIVESAYIVQIFIPDKDKSPHLMVGIRMPSHNPTVLRNAIAVSQPFITKEDLIDFMVVKDNDQLIKDVEPFFKNTILNKIKNILTGKIWQGMS